MADMTIRIDRTQNTTEITITGIRERSVISIAGLLMGEAKAVSQAAEIDLTAAFASVSEAVGDAIGGVSDGITDAVDDSLNDDYYTVQEVGNVQPVEVLSRVGAKTISCQVDCPRCTEAYTRNATDKTSTILCRKCSTPLYVAHYAPGKARANTVFQIGRGKTNE